MGLPLVKVNHCGQREQCVVPVYLVRPGTTSHWSLNEGGGGGGVYKEKKTITKEKKLFSQ